MKKVLLCIAGTLAYWVVMLFGYALIVRANDFGYSILGAEYVPGRVFHVVLEFLAQPLACVLAYAAIVGIARKVSKWCVVWNCSAAAILMGVLAIAAGDLLQVLPLALASAVCAGGVVITALEKGESE